MRGAHESTHHVAGMPNISTEPTDMCMRCLAVLLCLSCPLPAVLGFLMCPWLPALCDGGFCMLAHVGRSDEALKPGAPAALTLSTPGWWALTSTAACKPGCWAAGSHAVDTSIMVADTCHNGYAMPNSQSHFHALLQSTACLPTGIPASRLEPYHSCAAHLHRTSSTTPQAETSITLCPCPP